MGFELLSALIACRWVRWLAICLVAVTGYAFWEQRTEQKGADKVTVKIEQKASENAQTASDVRESAAKGRTGSADPYRRP